MAYKRYGWPIGEIPKKKKKKKIKKIRKIKPKKIKESTHYAHGYPKQKEIIRERDGAVCQLCQKLYKGKTENGYLYKMPIHHIDKNTMNCELDNLITLCNKCHRIVHSKKTFLHHKTLLSDIAKVKNWQKNL